jgi:hypothetical protein
MSVKFDFDYREHLRSQKPIIFGEQKIMPPKGSSAAIRVIPPLEIGALNTDVDFTSLQQFNLELPQNRALRAFDAPLPDVFDWRHVYPTDTPEIKKKKTLIARPGNQFLCGSCWSISACGVISDNFVVKGLVDWYPDLSTTWILACMPQGQCKGGNPAKCFSDVARLGVATNHCIDYSFCSQNADCNGSALKHLNADTIDLSKNVPSCGCYFSDVDHYLYKIDRNSQHISIGAPGVSEDNIAQLVKKHIFTNGSVSGGFLVYKNFIKGLFNKVNGGVYFEKGVYDDTGAVMFSEDSLSPTNYLGSHAVAIIGWGIAKNIVVDSTGKRDNVPYWYCRNSWNDKWGDGGYFKIAMYPYNKIVQFDKVVTIDGPHSKVRAGGIIMLSVSKPPVLKKLPQLKKRFMEIKRENEDSYYKSDPKTIPVYPVENGSMGVHDGEKTDEKHGDNVKKILLWFLMVMGVIFLMWYVWDMIDHRVSGGGKNRVV